MTEGFEMDHHAGSRPGKDSLRGIVGNESDGVPIHVKGWVETRICALSPVVRSRPRMEADID